MKDHNYAVECTRCVEISLISSEELEVCINKSDSTFYEISFVVNFAWKIPKKP